MDVLLWISQYGPAVLLGAALAFVGAVHARDDDEPPPMAPAAIVTPANVLPFRRPAYVAGAA